MKLCQALGVVAGDVVAFVGAGGKTMAMVTLADELTSLGWRVLATTTTQIDRSELMLFPRIATLDQGAKFLSDRLNQDRCVFLRDDVRGSAVFGPSPERLAWVLDSVDSDVLLVEADTARGLPFKAPLEDEPAIPREASLVVPMASLSALGQPLDANTVYNPEAMIERYGFYENDPIKSPWIAQVLRDDELGLKHVPPKARVISLLNQCPPEGYQRARARLIARLMLRSPRVNGVAIGDVILDDPIGEVQRPIGAIVLAAGMSRRMGQLKVLLPWDRGQTIIEHILTQLFLARVDQVTVVVGNCADEIKPHAETAGAETVFNANYETGDMLSSIKAGLRALPPNVAAALVVLGDQPRIQPRVVHQVMTAYAEGKGEIIAPSYQMRRGHPMLIDRRYWKEILDLPDDGALRDVINAHADRIAYVKVDNDSVLRDVDTPDDYRSERRAAGLNED
jgi:molybdenum cofactor cytidylyltransferase